MEYSSKIKKSLLLKGIGIYFFLVILQNLIRFIFKIRLERDGFIETIKKITQSFMPIFLKNSNSFGILDILNILLIILFPVLLILWGLKGKKINCEYKKKIRTHIFLIGWIFILFSLIISFSWSKNCVFDTEGYRGIVGIGGGGGFVEFRGMKVEEPHWSGYGFEINERYYNKNSELLCTLYRSPYVGIKDGVENYEFTIINQELLTNSIIKLCVLWTVFFLILFFIQKIIINKCLDWVLVKNIESLEINKEE